MAGAETIETPLLRVRLRAFHISVHPLNATCSAIAACAMVHHVMSCTQVPFESLKRTTRDRKPLLDDLTAVLDKLQDNGTAELGPEKRADALNELDQRLSGLKRKVWANLVCRKGLDISSSGDTLSFGVPRHVSSADDARASHHSASAIDNQPDLTLMNVTLQLGDTGDVAAAELGCC